MGQHVEERTACRGSQRRASYKQRRVAGDVTDSGDTRTSTQVLDDEKMGKSGPTACGRADLQLVKRADLQLVKEHSQ